MKLLRVDILLAGQAACSLLVQSTEFAVYSSLLLAPSKDLNSWLT